MTLLGVRFALLQRMGGEVVDLVAVLDLPEPSVKVSGGNPAIKCHRVASVSMGATSFWLMAGN